MPLRARDPKKKKEEEDAMDRTLSRRVIVVFVVAALMAGLGVFSSRDATAATWTHSVDGSYDVWYLDGAQKFRWHLTDHQWWHYSTNGLNWYVLSATGLPFSFVGSGAWNDLGNGFSYRYAVAYDYGYWMQGSTYRFYYQYGPGQWYHTAATLSWQVLGNAGLTASFLGDGPYHDLGNGFWYRYALATSIGFWSQNALESNQRFRYWYASGRWQHRGYDGVYYNLGPAGSSARFMADGAYHNLGNGFWYRFASANFIGIWSLNNQEASQRFRYFYGTGQWQHRGYSTAHFDLGWAGQSVSFMGDGAYHNLGNGFWYQYVGTGGPVTGYWSRDGTPAGLRFLYRYDVERWAHYGYGGTPFYLHSAFVLVSASFLGDGAYHDLGNGCWYRYYRQFGEGEAVWSLNGSHASARFWHICQYGAWLHFGFGGTADLLVSGVSASFWGDQSYHDLGNGFWYQYVRSTDVAHWSLNGSSTGNRYRYTYASGLWNHKGAYGSFNPLGHAGMNVDFLGDGNQHDLGNGYSYQLTGDVAYWSSRAVLATSYRYNYVTGLWQSRSLLARWTTLAGPGVGTDPYNPGEP